MLLLSNRKGDIFEELDIPIAFAPGFVNLHEFSKLHAKIRGSTYCWFLRELAAYQQLSTCLLVWHAFCPLHN
jgi:hypothetical protein